MIRTYIGLTPPPPPPSFPPPPPPPSPISTDASGCIAKAPLMFTNASQKYHRYITDHLSEQSAIVTECSANIRLYRRCFGEHSPNHRKSIFFSGTAGIYAQNRKALGSIAYIIIHFTIADAKIPNGTEALQTDKPTLPKTLDEVLLRVQTSLAKTDHYSYLSLNQPGL